MDIMRADYADTHYPCKLWESGKNGITLSAFEWDKASNILLYQQNDIYYGDVFVEPNFTGGYPTRLFHSAEIDQIMRSRDMETVKKFSDYNGTVASENGLQLMVISKKQG